LFFVFSFSVFWFGRLFFRLDVCFFVWTSVFSFGRLFFRLDVCFFVWTSVFSYGRLDESLDGSSGRIAPRGAIFDRCLVQGKKRGVIEMYRLSGGAFCKNYRMNVHIACFVYFLKLENLN